jgi:hypothetical protein
MISAPKNIYGIDLFLLFLHEVTLKRAAKILDVTERTIWRWKSEEKVPKAAVLALYWESSYGRSLIATDHHNEIVLLRTRIKMLEDQFVRAKDIITGLKLLNYGTANEPYYDEKGEFIDRTPPAAIPGHIPAGNEHSSVASPIAQGQSRLSTARKNGAAPKHQTRKRAV